MISAPVSGYGTRQLRPGKDTETSPPLLQKKFRIAAKRDLTGAGLKGSFEKRGEHAPHTPHTAALLI
ncbi:MAG: hypothetical protein LLG06_17910, partial [Desulfobacteraceae bacterium]|nr:hypothetical protein [Desulfobacteraceae bacterium]